MVNLYYGPVGSGKRTVVDMSTYKYFHKLK